jgi:hypothetical protein
MKRKLQVFRTSATRLIGLGLLTLAFGIKSNAQTYFTENFDGTWGGTPAAPSGWIQTRIVPMSAGATLTPFANGSSGEKDWQKSTFAAGWTPAPYSSSGPASGAVSGASALSMEDGNFNGSSTPKSERRIESPGFDISLSSSPYVRFWYYNSQAAGVTLNIRVVISNDGGVTWKTLSNVVNGYTVTNTTWQRINIKIPSAYKTANTKIGFAVVNRWGSADPFIDDVTVEEFTPTTITSAANGDWNVGATWVGGVVPTADNSVIIDHNVVITNTSSTTNIVGRCQDLTINAAKILSYGAGTANLLHVFGNLDISGTLNAFNGSSGRIMYLNGNVTINSGGTAMMSTGTTANVTTTLPTAVATGAAGFIFLNADAASFTNNGTLTNGRINNIWHAGSGSFTYNSSVGVPFTFGLIDGTVNPNGNLTLGNAGASSTTQNIIRVRGEFSSAPIFNNTNMTQRNVIYYSLNFTTVEPVNINTGEEIHDNSGRIVTGTFLMNTHNNVTLSYPLTVGTATTGGLTLSNGIIITSNTNLLTTSAFFAPPSGTSPSTATPPTTRGSYIAGPLKVNFPVIGTTARNFPLGVGTAFNGLIPNSNIRRNIAVSSTTTWNGQTITGSIEGAPSGAVAGTLSKTIGTRSYRLNLNGGNDLAATATVNITGNNYTSGNSDNLIGSINNLFVAQSTALTGTWNARTASSGTGAFVNNTDYSRTTATAAPGPVAPLATNGEYFAFASDAVLMTYTAGEVVRESTTLPVGASSNAQMLRIKITTAGVLPVDLNEMDLSTAGTNASAMANLTGAKLWYTGTSSTFATTTQFGTTTISPSGVFNIAGNQTLAVGDNYFWLSYDIGAGAALNDSFAAECISLGVNGISHAQLSPAAGVRLVSFPMTYLSSTTTQPLTSKVMTGTTNNVVIGVEVVGSALGSTIPLTSFDISTNGTDSLPDITNLKVWYTGASNTFAATAQFGSTIAGAPAATQTVTGNQGLINGTNYFWITYDINGSASVGHSVDAEITGFVVSGSAQIPTVTAPVGVRKVKGAYCSITSYTNGCGTDYIGRVRLGTLDNNTAACNGQYTFFGAVTVPTITRGVTDTITLNYGSDGNQYARAWIDYNDDGDYSDAGEDVGIQSPANAGANGQAKIAFTVPCDATVGQLRLRIRGGDDTQPTGLQSCGGGSTYGECEEYLVNLIDNPLAYISSSAEQNSVTVAPATNDVQILKVPVRVNGCGVATISEMRFSTSGSTSASDITIAKLYKTGTSSTFSTSNLIGTVFSPNGQFVYMLTDTVVNNATNNYWLAYDISGGATLTNAVDAAFDSLMVLGSYQVPTISAPAGNVTVDAPMTYSSSTVVQPLTTKVSLGSANNVIIGYQVVTSAIGSPVNLTSFDIAATGTDSLPDITNLKVWYTGSSNAFAATTQFGATVAAPAATQAVTGSVGLVNNNNYFWVTYDIAGGATLGHHVDAEISSATIDGITQTPTITAPAGSREIKGAYCIPAHSGGSLITNVTMNAMNYTPPATVVFYRSFPAATATATVIKNVPVNLSVTNNASSIVSVWIDYNDDGTFSASEWNQVVVSSVTNAASTVSITIPCTAVTGDVSMRIRSRSTGSPNGSGDACTTFFSGECQDYTITILDNPPMFNSVTAIQESGLAAPGTTDREVLRVPVKATGCGVPVATELHFSTFGSTAASTDIVSAKLYATGNSPAFNTSKLLGTVGAPNGAFTFMITDTLASNDTTNYWLAYDVAPGATLGNLIDATFDSIQAIGAYYLPTVSDPAGAQVITAPMTYVSSAATQPQVDKVELNSVNNKVVGFEVVTSATGSPVSFTSLDIATTGTDSLADITNIKVWYTGSSNAFAATTQFGSAVTSAAATQTVTGNQSLTNGTNYFWVTYDIAGTSTVGHYVDGEITSAIIGGSTQIPSVTAPAGARQIRNAYCTSAATNINDEEIISVTFGSMTNASACGVVASGSGSASSFYNNYTGLTPINVSKGSLVPFSLTLAECNTGAYTSSTAIYIDYNSDGDFTDADENVYSALSFTGVLTANGGILKSGNVTIPCTAATGETRMRIVYYETGSMPASCGAPSQWGETEDYMLNIVDNPLTYISSEAIQSVSTVAPASSDIQLLRVPVRVDGCGDATITEMRFSTAGSTVVSDIISAKLYKTDTSSTFSTANLIGTVFAPNGQFMFTLTDTVVSNYTTNYWLAYDISGSATLTNVVDATFDSLMVLGSYQVPSVSAPSGAVTVDAPMVYVSSVITQTNTSKIETGSVNNKIIGLEIVTSAIGSPEYVTSLDIATTGKGNRFVSGYYQS